MPAKQRALILAAGFGTRMGTIGKTLPKVMWPVFEMSLLEVQVRFARSLGYDDVYVNLHHQASEILERAKSRPALADVTWLVEAPEILDIGGGIHNLARLPGVQYSGELLVLNADQFLWFTPEDLARWRGLRSDWDAILLTWQVSSSAGYNRLDLDPSGRFRGITKNKDLARDLEITTYTGNALVNLSTLAPREGASSFFDSVCPPERTVLTASVSSSGYWDFGTAQRYWESMQKVLRCVCRGDRDDFVEFLKLVSGIDVAKARPELASYNCDVPGLIHLGSGTAAATHPPGVVIAGTASAIGAQPVLEFEGLVQPLTG